MTIVMEEGMFMIHLTGVIEVVVPISKCHHEQIPLVENTVWFMSAVKPETAMPNKIVNDFTCFIFVFVLFFVCVCFCFVLNYRVKAAILVGSVSSRNALHIIIYHIL